jgi:hypothetical protein
LKFGKLKKEILLKKDKMKKIINFLDYTPLSKVAIVGYLFWTLLTIVLFKLTDKFILDSQLDFNQTLKIGLIIGLLINVMFTIVVYNDRKSKSFWNYSNFIENLIENSKSKSELKSIFGKEFHELNKKSFSEVHNSEVYRIYSIINTKYNNLNA